MQRIESAFDVEQFLRWLAVNTAIQNWDAYGVMAHNYYLHGDPSSEGPSAMDPWDNNFSLGARFGFPGGGRGGFGGGPGGVPPFPGGVAPFPEALLLFPQAFHLLRECSAAASMSFTSRSAREWPLIQRLLRDEVYAARYRAHLEHALEGLFAPEAASKKLLQLHALIAQSVVGERSSNTTVSSPAAFESSVDGPDGLPELVRQRRDIVRTALKETPP